MLTIRISPTAILSLVCLPLITTLLLSAVAAGADVDNGAKSLAARVEQARAKKNVDDRLSALTTVGSALSLSEVPDAIKIAGDLTQLRERVILGEAVYKRWGELAPADAFKSIAKLPDGVLKLEAIRSVAPAYARKDIHAAVNDVMKMTPGRARNEAIPLIAETWARTDTQGALKWAKSLPDGFAREGAVRDIYFTWVHLDPAGISSTVTNLAPGDTRNALIINVAGDWAAQDPAKAVAWAEALPQEADRALALSTIAESWADVDPAAAAAFALKLSPSTLKQQAMSAVLERWATQDPHQAFLWISHCSDETLRGPGLARVLSVATPVSPDLSGQWVDQLAAGPVRESAIGSYVDSVCLWNPEAGVRLALKTVDPVARENRVERCVRQWLAWDPAGARKWLDQTNFPGEVKTRWLEEPSSNQP